MNKHDKLYLATVVMIALLILTSSLLPLWTAKLSAKSMDNKTPPPGLGKARRVDSQKIQALIDAGKLSAHEALWWESVAE